MNNRIRRKYHPHREKLAMEKYVTIGTDIATRKRVTISDTARRSGLYILGRPGTGKTTMLINLLKQDIENGHGLVFLDPHDDAINDLMTCGHSYRYECETIIFDLKDETHSFGINLLACKDVTSTTAREDAFSKARWVFHKLFEKELGDRPWLEMIIQYTLSVFIENQGYTFAEIPLFLKNPAFRKHLLKNVKYELEALDFWEHDYNPIQGEAVHTRIRSLLARPTV